MSLLQIQYDGIFELFLGSVTDYSLATLEEEDAKGLMSGWLRKGISRPYVKRIFSTSRFNDAEQMFEFQLAKPSLNESDEDQIDFVKGIAVKAMIIEWCTPLVMKTTNMVQMFGEKEQKYFSQALHLSELRGLLDDTKKELRQELGDRGVVINKYLGTAGDET